MFILVGIFSELFLVGEYMRFFYEDFHGLKDLLKSGSGILHIPCIVGIVMKNLVNIVELKHGMFRIIDYDIDEKR